MAERSFAFDATDPQAPDRTYASQDLARVFGSIVGRDGVIAGIDDELAVSPTEPESMAVQVGLGSAWIQGRYYNLYGTPAVLDIEAADDTNDRIDRVVVRMDTANAARKIEVYVKTGTPHDTPEPPSLTRDTEAWEISLAQVLVEANASEIEAEDITDERGDASLCGFVPQGAPLVFDITTYGAVGDGSTDCTDAIQAAIDAAEAASSGVVFFPEGRYLVTDVLEVSKATIHLVGSGYNSVILVSSDMGGDKDVIHITSSFPYNRGFKVAHLRIAPQAGTPARYGLHFDATSSWFANVLVENCWIEQLGDNAIHLTHPVDGPGLFTSVIRDNLLYGGTSWEKLGDSVHFERNVVTGSGTAFDITMVPGAAQVVIRQNNVTTSGGAVVLGHGCAQVKIVHNQFEQVETYTGDPSVDAVIAVMGAVGFVLPNIEIEGNNVNPHGNVASAIRIERGTLCTIRKNTLAAGTSEHILVGAGAGSTFISQDNRYTTTAVITDNGAGTIGVDKVATLENNWDNADESTYGLAGFFKDESNVVHLHGVLKDGTTTLGTTIFTLPPLFRPPQGRLFAVQTNSGTGLEMGQIAIEADGSVRAVSVGASALYLDNVSFKAS